MERVDGEFMKKMEEHRAVTHPLGALGPVKRLGEPTVSLDSDSQVETM